MTTGHMGGGGGVCSMTADRCLYVVPGSMQPAAAACLLEMEGPQGGRAEQTT